MNLGNRAIRAIKGVNEVFPPPLVSYCMEVSSISITLLNVPISRPLFGFDFFLKPNFLELSMDKV